MKRSLLSLGVPNSWRVSILCLVVLFSVCDLCNGQASSSEIEDLILTVEEVADFDTQQSILDSAMKMARASKGGLDKHLMSITSMRAFSYMTHGMKVETLDQYFLSLSAQEFSGMSDYQLAAALFWIYTHIANILLDASLFAESIPYYDSAIVRGEKLLLMDEDSAYYQEDLENLIDLKVYRAKATRSIGKLDLAIGQLKELLPICESLGNPYSCFRIINNLGLMTENTEESRSYHKKTLEIEDVSLYGKGIAMHNIANTYFEEKKYDKSLIFLDSAVTLKKELLRQYHPDAKSSLFQSLMDRGELHIKLLRYEEAIRDLEEALKLEHDFKDEPEFFEVYQFLKQANDSVGNSSLSQIYDNLYDIYKTNYDQSERTIQAANDSEAIRALLDSIEDNSLRKKIKTEYLLFGISGVLFLGLVAYYWLSKRRSRRKKVLFSKLGGILMDDSEST